MGRAPAAEDRTLLISPLSSLAKEAILVSLHHQNIPEKRTNCSHHLRSIQGCDPNNLGVDVR